MVAKKETKTVLEYIYEWSGATDLLKAHMKAQSERVLLSLSSSRSTPGFPLSTLCLLLRETLHQTRVAFVKFVL